MKKLFTLFFALLVTSNLWATIIYEKNGGKFNDYDWKNKGDMFAACMADGGVTGLASLDEVKALDDPFATICTPLQNGNVTTLMSLQKWDWLEEYILTAQNAQKGNAVGSSTVPGLTAGTASAAWRYAIAAFFLETQRTGWPYSADFSEAGKDAAYLPAWGQNYGNPTDPTEEVTLVAPYRAGYLFDGWYASADFSGEKVTTVDQNTTGTLYAKWVLDGIVYELNGGEWNKYGWEDKGDMYDAFISEWKAYEGSDVTNRVTVPYEDQLGIGKSNGGIPTTIGTTALRDNLPAMFMHNDYSAKWGWLAKYMDIVAATQYKKMNAANGPKVQPTTNGAALTFSLGNFFGEDKNHTTDYIDAVDFTGEEAHLAAFQSTWGQTFPNPEHPTEEVTLHTPFKEGYKFLGWYDNEACTGTPVTTVNASTTGTLYAKWVMDGIVYERNGGVWNENGWTSKKDMYDAFLADWKAYSGSTRGTKTYEEQLGVGKSSAGIPTTISNTTPSGVEYRSLIIPFFTESNYQTKWGWLATYIDAIAAQQGKTQPTTSGITLTFSLGNFFGEDNAQTTGYINAVDFTGSEAQVEAFQYTWGQSFPGIEHPTESTVLHIAYKPRHTFEGWYDNAECTGTAITTVDENYAGTLYAKWSLAPVLYNLNGGQYNEYGWESKKDMYEDLNVDWNAFANRTNTWPAYETVYGVGNSNNGVAGKTDATFSTFFTNASYKDKWGWIVTYLDAIATKQGKTLPSTDAIPLRWGVGNFLCDDNNGSTTWHKAVDCTGEDGQLYTAQEYCSFTLPNPMYPTKEVTLNNPTKEGYIFDGWYAAADFSGAAVTKVNANTKGTLYAKWTRNEYTRSVTSGRYGTICLPYNANYFEGAIFYEVSWMNTSVSPWQVLVEEVTELEAGKPYIFMATSNNILVACQGDAIADPSNYNGLYGTFTNIEDGAAGAAGNVLEGNHMLSNNQIMKCLGNCQLLANRAYFKLDEIRTTEPALVPGRRRVALGVQGGNEATGLDNLTEDGVVPAMEGTYDVLGRKMTEPTNNGFYIVNGKKVVVLK